MIVRLLPPACCSSSPNFVMAGFAVRQWPHLLLVVAILGLFFALAGCNTTGRLGAICVGGEQDGNNSSCLELRTWNQPPPNGGIDEKSGYSPSGTVQ